MSNKNQTLKITDDTIFNVGDYFRVYKSKYFTRVKEIGYNQRGYEDQFGEYYITMLKVDIYDKNENLLASDSIVPVDKLATGALARYIPDLDYGPTYLGSLNPYDHSAEFKIWTDITDRCFKCRDTLFPYIGGVGTTVCDRWRCFEYFFADLRHMEGYAEAKDNLYYNHYIVDLYDMQKHIHPSQRIYAPGYVKLKPFKKSDICMYCNTSINSNKYPKDIQTTTKYMHDVIDIKETLYKKQTGMNVKMDLSCTYYYYDCSVGYQPLVAMNLYPYNSIYLYNNIYYYQQPMRQPLKQMCTIVK